MEKIKNNNIYIDENVVSLVAYQVVLIALFGLYFQQVWLLIFLGIDFFSRASGLFPSPLSYIAKGLCGFLSFQKKPVFAAPKRFAAFLGLLMTALIIIFFGTQLSIYLVIILAVLASLESIFHVCVGCYIYNFLVLPILQKFNRQK